MSSAQCNGVSKPAGWKGKDGRLWFPTTRGVVVVDPNAIREDDAPPPVVIEGVMADKKVVSEKVGKWVSENVSLTHSLTHPLTLPPGRGELEFHYTALSYRAPEKNRFKYKLEGYDADWVDAATRRVAYYNNIKPGTYTFRVQGCNNDGVWNKTGASVKLSLRPHFWQTKWFLGLLGVMSIGFVAGTARYITWKKVQRKLERFEQQHAIEKERTRIAQDMHDDLGIRLTEILLLGNLAADSNADKVNDHVTKMVNVARDVVRGLDAIVWAVNPKNDSLDQLALYTGEYLEKILGMTNIRCRLDVPVELPHQALSADVRHNLFLVIKEAVNNSVKYAEATELKFSLRVSDFILFIVIEDNGKGFSVAENSARGNGLQNMERRLKNIGGRFEISSEPEKGTRIRLEIPLSRE